MGALYSDPAILRRVNVQIDEMSGVGLHFLVFSSAISPRRHCPASGR